MLRRSADGARPTPAAIPPASTGAGRLLSGQPIWQGGRRPPLCVGLLAQQPILDAPAYFAGIAQPNLPSSAWRAGRQALPVSRHSAITPVPRHPRAPLPMARHPDARGRDRHDACARRRDHAAAGHEATGNDHTRQPPSAPHVRTPQVVSRQNAWHARPLTRSGAALPIRESDFGRHRRLGRDHPGAEQARSKPAFFAAQTSGSR